MRVLGLDPGYAILGYGIVDVSGSRISVVDYGTVETTPQQTFPERLERLYLGTRQLVELFRPDAIAFEELFSPATRPRR